MKSRLDINRNQIQPKKKEGCKRGDAGGGVRVGCVPPELAL